MHSATVRFKTARLSRSLDHGDQAVAGETASTYRRSAACRRFLTYPPLTEVGSVIPPLRGWSMVNPSAWAHAWKLRSKSCICIAYNFIPGRNLHPVIPEFLPDQSGQPARPIADETGGLTKPKPRRAQLLRPPGDGWVNNKNTNELQRSDTFGKCHPKIYFGSNLKRCRFRNSRYSCSKVRLR